MKMKSRFAMSNKDQREAVKAHVIPSAAEVKAMGRDPSMTRREWQRQQRMSMRQMRVYFKRQPMFDMDGSYYHG